MLYSYTLLLLPLPAELREMRSAEVDRRRNGVEKRSKKDINTGRSVNRRVYSPVSEETLLRHDTNSRTDKSVPLFDQLFLISQGYIFILFTKNWLASLKKNSF